MSEKFVFGRSKWRRGWFTDYYSGSTRTPGCGCAFGQYAYSRGWDGVELMTDFCRNSTDTFIREAMLFSRVRTFMPFMSELFSASDRKDETTLTRVFAEHGVVIEFINKYPAE